MRYFLIKAFYALLVFAGVVTIVFMLFQGLGDPTRLVMGQTGDKATMENIRRELHLDKPKWQQFVLYINDISPLSIHTSDEINNKQLNGIFAGEGTKKIGLKIPYLRQSYQTKRPVLDVLLEALPGTLVLTVAAMLLAACIGIPAGMLAAVKQNTWVDTTTIVTTIMGISAPSFFIGIIIAYTMAIALGQYTGLPLTGSLFEYNDVTGERYISLKNLILPAFTLGIRPLAIITQITRSTMLDVLKQDYIRTAYAKGLSKRNVLIRHALPNALNPVITTVTGWFAELMAGAFFIEYIFGWHGLGKITVDALEKLDFPIVMGSVLLTATFFILINLISDALYRWVDPRVKM